MLARCPSCRNTFSTDLAGRQNCPVCGKPLIVPEPAKAVMAEPAQEAAGTPWERRREIGSLSAWLQTVQQALFEPVRLFHSARLDRGAAQLGFAVLTTSVFSAIGQLFELLLRARTQALTDRIYERLGVPPEMFRAARQMGSPGWVALGILLLPMFALVFLYLNAAVTHFFALLLGQAKRGFAATFAACAYASAPLVLLAVPGCGFIIAVVWLVVLTGVGLKETHRISPAGAAGATLAPYLFFCCLGALAGLFLGMRMRQAMGQP